MRLTHTTIIAAIGFGSVWLAAMASCNDEDPDNLLTTVATSMSTTSGMGGTSTDGGGGAGAEGGAEGGSGGAATGGNGGQGGMPPTEEVLHNCLSTTATDLTGGDGGAGGAGMIEVQYPAGPLCIIVADGAVVDFVPAGDPSVYRVVYGTYDGGVKSPRVQTSCTATPIVECPNWNAYDNGMGTRTHYCPNSPYVCADPAPMDPLRKVNAEDQVNGYGVFPFYDDKNPGGIQGVIYVE